MTKQLYLNTQIENYLNNNHYNPIGNLNINRARYTDLWRVYDLNQYCNFLKWNNLPKNLTSWNLNRMLYYRGSLVGFKFAEEIYILPYANNGELNAYGLSKSVTPIAYNGKVYDKTDLPFVKDFLIDFTSNEKQGAMLYDNIPIFSNGVSVSRAALNEVIIDDIAEVLARIKINVAVSNKKLFLTIKDSKQADIAKLELENAFSSDSAFAVIQSDFDINSLQSVSDYQADNLFNTLKNYDSIRCMQEGIPAKNFGVEKKERLITDELVDTDSQINLIANSRIDLANQFCEEMNEIFGLNMSVEINLQEQEEKQQVGKKYVE